MIRQGRREKWFAFDASRELHERVKAAAAMEGSTLREFCVSALEDAVGGGHSVAVAVTESSTEACENLMEFARDGRAEIVFVGTTLKALSCPKGEEFLLMKVGEGVHLTFLLGYPPAVVDAHPHKTWLKREALLEALACRSARPSRLAEGVQNIVHSLVRSMGFFKWLKSQAPRFSQGPDLVRVVGLTALPTMGLTIVDPLLPGSKMRASLYVHQYPELCDPTLILGYPGGTASEMQMYGALYTHYDRLRSTSEELVDLESAEAELQALAIEITGNPAPAYEPTPVPA